MRAFAEMASSALLFLKHVERIDLFTIGCDGAISPVTTIGDDDVGSVGGSGSVSGGECDDKLVLRYSCGIRHPTEELRTTRCSHVTKRAFPILFTPFSTFKTRFTLYLFYPLSPFYLFSPFFEPVLLF
jgi:hypothetical protein